MIRRALLLAAAALPLALATPFVLTSCAGSDEGNAAAADASSTLDAPASDAPSIDGGDAGESCDAGDPSCVSELLSCDEADFCPVAAPVDRRYTLTAVWGSGASDVWAVGSGGTILRWNGTAWSLVPSGTTDTLNAISGSGPTDVWAVGSTAAILHGPQWASDPALPNDPTVFHARMLAVWAASAADVRVAGQPFFIPDPNGGDPLRANLVERAVVDGGPGWLPRQGLDGKYARGTVHAIWGSSTTDVWVALDNAEEEPWARATLVHGTGQPLAWTAVDSQANAALEGLWGSGASDVWAVGGNGTIRRFTAGATKWMPVSAPTTKTLHAVWGSGPNDVWAVGDVGTILHYDGTSWRSATAAFPLGRKPDLTGVWCSGPNDVWIVGDGLTLHFTGKKASR